jgi:hypothetical protein
LSIKPCTVTGATAALAAVGGADFAIFGGILGMLWVEGVFDADPVVTEEALEVDGAFDCDSAATAPTEDRPDAVWPEDVEVSRSEEAVTSLSPLGRGEVFEPLVAVLTLLLEEAPSWLLASSGS